MRSMHKVTIQPTAEPISTTDIAAYLRIDDTSEDTLLAGLITRARALGETITHRALATQTVRQEWTAERRPGGILYGAFEHEREYVVPETQGADPFSLYSPYYFDLALPPVQTLSSIETRVDVWSSWSTFAGTTSLDSTSEPARLYIQNPLTAYQWRAVFVAGYSAMPPDLLQALYEAVAFLYANREAQCLPDALMYKFLAHRVDWV